MQLNSKRKTTVGVNLKPTQMQLDYVVSLQKAVDTLIINNAFIESNPLRENYEEYGALFFDWVVVNVNGLNIPTPIHTISKSECVLYRWDGTDVLLSYEECAYTTAIFYLDCLRRLATDWDRVISSFNSMHLFMLSGGIKQIAKINDSTYADIIFALKSKLSEKGFSVLD